MASGMIEVSFILDACKNIRKLLMQAILKKSENIYKEKQMSSILVSIPDPNPGWLEFVTDLNLKEKLIHVLRMVAIWQHKKRLIPDGLIGPRTWNQRDSNLIIYANSMKQLMEESDKLKTTQTYMFLKSLTINTTETLQYVLPDGALESRSCFL
jgi:hypothetical protein